MAGSVEADESNTSPRCHRSRSSEELPSLHPPALSIPSQHPGGFQEGGKGERSNPGSCCCPQEQPRPSQQAEALLLFPASGIASLTLNRCSDQGCCSLLLPGSCKAWMCCLEAGNDQEQDLDFPGLVVWKSRVSFSPLGILCPALVCVVQYLQMRQLLNIPKICLSLNHRVYT